MITYTVKFKRQGSWTFETLKDVKEDGINEGAQSRFFILQDDSRVELPVSCYFVFSKERYELITQLRHKEASQAAGSGVPGVPASPEAN